MLLTQENNRPQRPVACVFDFDGTLTSEDTFLLHLRHMAGLPRMLWGMLLHVHWLVLMKLRLADNGRVKQRVFSHFFRGMTLQDYDAHLQRLVADTTHVLRPDGMRELQEALQAGHLVFVVSASAENRIRAYLPDPRIHVLATRLEDDGERLTGRFATRNCYGAEKVERLRKAVGDLNNVYIVAYGDSRGDKEMFHVAQEVYYQPFG